LSSSTNGPDWQLKDLISSDIWAGGSSRRRAGAARRQESFRLHLAGRLGRRRAALHYFANFPRYLPTDFKIKSEHDRAHDWPISYEDVAPFYDKVAADIGVSGDAKAEEKWRPAGAPYPMPPMKTFPNGEVWLKAARGQWHPFCAVGGRHDSTAFKGRPACLYDGWCHVGCPTGALANPVVTYLDEARKADAEVRALCTVTRVLTNQEGSRATGVEYYDDKKQKQVQEASVVILAAWSAQNPRLLLNSATDKHPKGLANSNELVGKFMMTHHIAGTWALFDEDITRTRARSARSFCHTTVMPRPAIRQRSAARSSSPGRP